MVQPGLVLGPAKQSSTAHLAPATAASSARVTGRGDQHRKNASSSSPFRVAVQRPARQQAVFAGGGTDERPVLKPRPLGPVGTAQPPPCRGRDEGGQLVCASGPHVSGEPLVAGHRHHVRQLLLCQPVAQTRLAAVDLAPGHPGRCSLSPFFTACLCRIAYLDLRERSHVLYLPLRSCALLYQRIAVHVDVLDGWRSQATSKPYLNIAS